MNIMIIKDKQCASIVLSEKKGTQSVIVDMTMIDKLHTSYFFVERTSASARTASDVANSRDRRDDSRQLRSFV